VLICKPRGGGRGLLQVNVSQKNRRQGVWKEQSYQAARPYDYPGGEQGGVGGGGGRGGGRRGGAGALVLLLSQDYIGSKVTAMIGEGNLQLFQKEGKRGRGRILQRCGRKAQQGKTHRGSRGHSRKDFHDRKKVLERLLLLNRSFGHEGKASREESATGSS